MNLSIVVAMADNGVIGRDNALPWHLPADLERFKAITLGHPLIMGRQTFESIGRPLPQRRNLVLSRDPRFAAAGIEVFDSLTAALAAVAEEAEVFVIGGAALFAEALPRAQRLFLTRVHGDVDGDTFFPPLELAQWHRVTHEHHDADERHALAFTIEVWERGASVDPQSRDQGAS